MAGATHVYRSELSWEGSTVVGYDSYERTHRISLQPAAEGLVVSSDPAFNGNPELTNPE